MTFWQTALNLIFLREYNMNVEVKIARNYLEELRSKVIGVYKENNDAAFELVVDGTATTIDTIRITQFGAIQENFGLPIRGKLLFFPQGKSLTDMVNTPFEWAKFIEQF